MEIELWTSKEAAKLFAYQPTYFNKKIKVAALKGELIENKDVVIKENGKNVLLTRSGMEKLKVIIGINIVIEKPKN
jgi:hypothetical protein